MSKSVSWRISSKESRPVRYFEKKAENEVNTRDRATWTNCKKKRPITAGHIIRVRSPLASTVSLSTKSSYALSSRQSDTTENDPERGRENFRRKARSQLKLTFPTKFSKFDPSDLRLRGKTEVKKSHLKTYTQSANAIVTSAMKAEGRVYFINGVASNSYRRPSIQFTDEESGLIAMPLDRRFSEPAFPSYIEIQQPNRPKTKRKIPGKAKSITPSTSAPATIASNDESEKSSRDDEIPSYLSRDWRSDILSRYSNAQPWTPKYRTNRYFPKYSNMQDLHCKNPYLFPGGLLYENNDSKNNL